MYEFSLSLQFSNFILVSWSCYSAFKLISATFHSKTIVDMSLNRPSILSLDDLADLRSMVRLVFRRPFRQPACTSQATDCRNLVYQVVAHESENSPPIMNESHHVLRQQRRRGRINTVQIPRSKSKSKPVGRLYTTGKDIFGFSLSTSVLQYMVQCTSYDHNLCSSYCDMGKHYRK
jgi:hypothetical protein